MSDIVPTFSRALVSSARAIILIAWTNIFLLTTELTLGFFYIIYNHINRRTKSTILCALFVDLACVVLLCAEVIDIVTLGRKKEWAYSWHTGVIIILSHLAGSLGQGAFFYTYWQSSPRSSRGLIIFATILLSLRFIFVIVENALILSNRITSLQTSWVFGNVSALVGSLLLFFTDLCIVYLFAWRRRTKFVLYGSWTRKIEQVTTFAISLGIINMLVSTLSIVLYFLHFLAYRSSVHIIGRVYTLTLIITYITNKEGQELCSTTTSRNTSTRTPRTTYPTNTIQLTTISDIRDHIIYEDTNGGSTRTNFTSHHKVVSDDLTSMETSHNHKKE